MTDTPARPRHRRHWHAPERGTGPAFALSLAAHALLFLAIAFAVRWSTQPVGPVAVELWSGSPPPVAVEPVRPVPPPPPPRIEPEPARKADIVLEPKKAPPKAEPKKEEPKKEEPKKIDPKLEAKRVADAKAAEAKKISEAKAAETKQAAERHEAALKRMTAAAAGPAGAANGVSSAGGVPRGYDNQIVACIRPHIVFNVPEGVVARRYVAEFEVQLAPTGEQLGAPKLLKPSGLAAYDQAVERAIRRCDPFPRPQEGAMPRVLRLNFDPVETR